MPVKTTMAYKRISRLTKKIKVIQGGQGASKTYSICQILFELSINNPYELSTIATDTYPRLEDGALTDMRNIFRDAGMEFARMYNGQKKNLNFSNGSIIQFRNIDKYNIDAGKGPRRDNLFLNEANRLGWLNIEQAWNRTKKNIYVDYNPDREFWYNENLKSGEFSKEEIDFIVLTYLDNQMIDEGELKTILRKKQRAELIEEKKLEGIQLTRSENQALLWWKIYGLGELGTYSDRQIYSYEWGEVPETAKRISSGMDFAKSPDQTALIDLYLDGVNLYADERFCLNNLMEEKIEGSPRMSVVDQMNLIEFKKGWQIIGDSSGKTTILDMRKHGYNIVAVKKTLLVLEGIGKLRSYNLIITKRSVNLKKGIESWFWKVDPNGKIIPEPDGHEPDSLAALRYAIISVR
jgi:phage terminase large subunit